MNTFKTHRDSRIVHSRKAKKLADNENNKKFDFWCSYKSKNNGVKLFPRSPFRNSCNGYKVA